MYKRQANESAWGSSWIAQNKNNLFGLNAVSYTHLDVYKRQTPYLPENTKLVDESQKNIAVTISVSEGGSRRIHIPVSSIIPRELEEGLKVSFDSEQIELAFTGSEENLKKLDASKINVYIDMKDYNLSLIHI